jgi:hypothetical protein
MSSRTLKARLIAEMGNSINDVAKAAADFADGGIRVPSLLDDLQFLLGRPLASLLAAHGPAPPM